jgi:hypothetical protein
VRKPNEFQMRLEGGSYYVFMTRVGNRDVPRLRQQWVHATPHRAAAQTLCDALNNGMLTRILLAMKAAGDTGSIT